MEVTYYKCINANPHFSFKDLAFLIKKSIMDRKSYCINNGVRLGGVLYNISFEPSSMELYISFNDENGYKIKRMIRVIEEYSNLPTLSESKVYYFVCPYKGVKCRKLYRVGSFFWSRKAFKALYPLQMESKRSRLISYKEEPYRKNGKEYYRGKITPYGRRCLRYENREQERLGFFLCN